MDPGRASVYPFTSPPGATPFVVASSEGAWLPDGIVRGVFTSGGSEAMDGAIRLAVQHHVSAGRSERWKVIGRDLSYHGTTLATLAIGGHARRRAPFGSWLVDLPKAPACYCLRCPLGKQPSSCCVACADEAMTGFGRTGRRFALDHWEIAPDILVSGKGLSGGYAPMGGIFAREEVVAPIAERGDDLMFYTYSAHSGACAAAEKVMSHGREAA